MIGGQTPLPKPASPRSLLPVQACPGGGRGLQELGSSEDSVHRAWAGWGLGWPGNEQGPGMTPAGMGEWDFMQTGGFQVLFSYVFVACTASENVGGAQSCPTLCDPMDCSTPGFPVLHHLPELAQTDVHSVGDAIQPSSSVVPFSSCLQPFPTSGSFPVSRVHQSTGTSASVFSMNIQG